MRTTLTIDEDNAALLERLRKEREVTLKELINEALRAGLLQLTKPDRTPRERFTTPTMDLGKCLLPNLDNTEEVLDRLYGPFRR